jgi:hypothetical protein
VTASHPTAGTVLGEGWRITIERAVRDILNSEEWRDLMPLPYPDMIAAEVAEKFLDDTLSALLSSAREGGAAAERGHWEWTHKALVEAGAAQATAEARLRAVRELHSDSVAGPCPSCGDLADCEAGGDGLVPYPCPTLVATGVPADAGLPASQRGPS